MNGILLKFKNFEIDKSGLKKELGEDLYNIDFIKKPLLVSSRDLVIAIKEYESGIVSLEQLVDWVNIVWFTDLFEFSENESDSIISVLGVLETLDEGIDISEDELQKMQTALIENSIYGF